jgi:predicted enzyme related to lactoylglutathione lyase
MDPSGLADFWSAALGLPERKDREGEVILAAQAWPYPRYTFQRVADGQARSTSAVHVDLLADDREAEVERLVELGASVVRTEFGDASGVIWTVLRDPDGNEFCVS